MLLPDIVGIIYWFCDCVLLLKNLTKKRESSHLNSAATDYSTWQCLGAQLMFSLENTQFTSGFF